MLARVRPFPILALLPPLMSLPLPIVDEDPWLEPYRDAVARRRERYGAALASLGDLRRYASAHQHYGIHRVDGGWVYREWAPRAGSLALVGDFNGWDRAAHPLGRVGDDGDWEVFVPDAAGLAHGGRVKVHVVGANGAHDRIPAYIRRAVQDPESKDFCGQVWQPEQSYAWREAAPDLAADRRPLLIYEAHVGMSGEAGGVASYQDFADKVLPRIAAGGYTAVQLMAVAEHPYYGSFGYHVANFFAPSSRCGTPEELKALVDRAHGLGLAVLMDVVHSHSVKNRAEGLAEFDGQPGLYFKGEHPQWDSMLFDYARPGVRRFLLSNVAYWLEEFRFDGFRFDGVTSMLYHHHGDTAFDHYDKYFGREVDDDAVTYLQLACAVARSVRPGAVTVAEDFSGMPGMCRAPDDGGLGLDYRLGMGVPDAWIKLLKHRRDEDWDVGGIWGELANRRAGERTVAYCESHDQALVGDKTIAFWLMDAEMYTGMSKADASPVIDRGVALHKMIRLVTLAAGGEAYLNFMGNEFGHPEWVDFPREGNGWSYHYARRQWSLADNPELRYADLLAFDKAMLELAGGSDLFAGDPAELLNLDQENHCLMFRRGGLVFAFNFHPERSIPGYRFGVGRGISGDLEVALDSDAREFGGFGRIDSEVRFPTVGGQVSIYLPSRVALVLRVAV